MENLESSWGFPDGDITVGGRTITSCFDLGLLCVFPDGELLTLGLLECIDWNPELSVTNWDGLTEFLSGCSRSSCWEQRKLPAACLVRPLMLAAGSPFSSSFFSAVEVGPSPLTFQHSPSVCLLLPKENLASPGHTEPQGSGHCRVHPVGEESGAPSSKVTLTFQVVHVALPLHWGGEELTGKENCHPTTQEGLG